MNRGGIISLLFSGKKSGIKVKHTQNDHNDNYNNQMGTNVVLK